VVRRIAFFSCVLVCALPFVPPQVALGLGAIVGLGIGHPYAEKTRSLAPKLLAASVVGLGADVDLVAIGRVGMEGATLTLLTLALCLGLGFTLTKLLRVERRVGLLIAVGTAICGGSAIAAVAPVLRAKDEETSVALGTVFLLNAVALVALPLVGRALALDADTFGTYAALAVHDTSSVVGAAMSFGDRAVAVATSVKLARAMWIVPVTLTLGALVSRSREGRERGPLPFFILFFLFTALLFTFVPAVAPARALIAGCARRAMVVTLFLVGAGLSREGLGHTGFRPLALGAVLWVFVAALSLALVST
jgi:uncharacterized integral membrane protein (TIGR00698 family)